jgi:Fic family protein
LAIYIHKQKEWPDFHWKQEHISPILAQVRYRQGRLLGRMEGIGFNLQAEASLLTLTLDVQRSGEIDGEMLNPDQVRSSIARRLGMDVAGIIPADRPVEGIVEMMLDATQNYKAALTNERLFSWHAAMFPGGRSGMGKEKVHFQAPDSDVFIAEMNKFLGWFNRVGRMDPVIKAAIAHVWFVTIRPFDDGNGRIARAIADMQLSRADQCPQRFYSISAQIRNERKGYFEILEKTQKGTRDITEWLEWFLNCLDRALANTDETVGVVIQKARFWETHATTPFNDRQRTMLNKLLAGFDGKLTSSNWARITKSSQDSAGRDINDLVQRGILVKEPGGGRSTSYMLTIFN